MAFAASSTTTGDHPTRVAADGLVAISPLKKMAMEANEQTPIRIGQVVSTDLIFDVGHGRTVTLRDVPVFLVGAFNQIRLHGMETEGLFRREGNATRLKMIWGPYHGHVGIPAVCTIPDICSMIKRFFRESQKPLFADLQSQLLQFAVSIDHEPTKLKSILQLCHVLPAAHLGTLGYLMRQLKFLADNSEKHQMTAENLATVFAPTLFREEPTSTKKAKKESKGSQDDLLAAVRVDTTVKISLVKLLIEHADLIGVMSDAERPPLSKRYSTASEKYAPTAEPPHQSNKSTPSHPTASRSSSAKPTSRSANNSSGRLRKDGKPDRRFARKDDEEKLDNGRSSKQRRSSSTVRDVFNSIASKLRSKSPPPSPPVDATSKSTVVTGADNGDFTVSKLRHALDDTNAVSRRSPEQVPDPQTKLVFEYDSPRSDLSDEQRGRRQSSTTSLITSPPRMTATVQRVQSTKSTASRTQTKAPNVFEWSSPAMEPTTVSSKAVSPPYTPASGISLTTGYRHQLPTVVDNSPAAAVSTTPAAGRTLRTRSSFNVEEVAKAVNLPANVTKMLPNDQCHSLLSADYLATNKHQPDRRRRHTAPIRNNPLRRNQPNTVNSGLKNPKDRRLTAILTTDATTDPQTGGGIKRRSRSVERFAPTASPSASSADEDDQIAAMTTADESALDSAALLEQKGLEARQRRAKRMKRKEAETAAAATMTSPIKTTEVVKATNSPSDPTTSVLKDHNEMASPTASTNDDQNVVTITKVPEKSLPLIVVDGPPSDDTSVGTASLGTKSDATGNDDDFADSDIRREQLLAASDHRDLRSGPAHVAMDNTRPSVAFIQKHRRGLVQQRVSQFVNIAESNSVEHLAAADGVARGRHSTSSATDAFRLDSDGFVKPMATPAARASRSSAKTCIGLNSSSTNPPIPIRPPKVIPKRLNAATSSPKSPLRGVRGPANRSSSKSSPLREIPAGRSSPRKAPLINRI
uniref:Rho-GAP domain-containing protein n=1 Tax=Plectus sambesii TaxID=2011161 RepID=A0A914UXZ5_9BILA